MVRTLGDLTIDSKVWSQDKNIEPIEWTVSLLSKSKIVFSSANQYDRTVQRSRENLTAFKFVGMRDGSQDLYYTTTFYTEKIHALKSYRASQEAYLVQVYKSQKEFLEKLIQMNEKIRSIDDLIANELHRKK